MKSSLLAVIFGIGSLGASAQTLYPGNISGCIGRWDFKTNATITNVLNDASGNNNHGQQFNIASVAGWRGEQNEAGRFDGNSSYGLVNNSANLSPQQYTFAGLLVFNGFYSGNCQISTFVSKGWPHNIPGNYGLGVTDGVYDGSCSIYSPNNFQMWDFNRTTGNIPTASNYVQPNKWYFVAMTFDGSVAKYFQEEMNPNLLAATIPPIYTSASVPVVIGTNTQPLSIGSHMDPSFRYWFNGLMDEVVLFNRALTDAEVLSVYKTMFRQPTPNAVAKTEGWNDISIWVNNGSVEIRNTGAKRIEGITIFNTLGQTIREEKNTNSFISLDMSNVRGQMLFVRVKMSDDTFKTVTLTNM